MSFIGSYSYCPKHINSSAKNNANNNGTEKHYASLRKHYAKKKARVDVEISVAARIALSPDYFASLLEPISDMLLSPKAIIYDTESDGVGASYDLDSTREYHFYNVAKQEHLNITARFKNKTVNPDYSHEDARVKILAFIQDAAYLVAYEPPSNDRNRLKSLFGDEEYEAHIAPKVVCFKRGVVSRIFTTKKEMDHQFVYLQGLMQTDVFLNLLQVNGQAQVAPPDYFLPVPKSLDQRDADGKDQKCEKDVLQLSNLYLFFRSAVCHPVSKPSSSK